MSETPQPNPEAEKQAIVDDINQRMESGGVVFQDEYEEHILGKKSEETEGSYEPNPNELDGEDLEEREHGKKHEMY